MDQNSTLDTYFFSTIFVEVDSSKKTTIFRIAGK